MFQIIAIGIFCYINSIQIVTFGPFISFRTIDLDPEDYLDILSNHMVETASLQ